MHKIRARLTKLFDSCRPLFTVNFVTESKYERDQLYTILHKYMRYDLEVGSIVIRDIDVGEGVDTYISAITLPCKRFNQICKDISCQPWNFTLRKLDRYGYFYKFECLDAPYMTDRTNYTSYNEE